MKLTNDAPDARPIAELDPRRSTPRLFAMQRRLELIVAVAAIAAVAILAEGAEQASAVDAAGPSPATQDSLHDC